MSRGNPLFVPAGTSRGTVLPVNRLARLHPAPRAAAVRGVKREYGDERAKPLITTQSTAIPKPAFPPGPMETEAGFLERKPEPATSGRRKKRFDPGRAGRG
jgi:hypothetical protein